MLIGEHYTNLGEKNRISLPKKLLSELSVDLVLTRGYEQSVILVDKQRWQNLITEINQRPLLNMDVRDTKRFLIGGAHTVELDAQARFVMPEFLIEYGSLSKELALIGVGEWLEIWDKQRWQTKLLDLSSKSADIADRLSNLT
jgi:MraZ protein